MCKNLKSQSNDRTCWPITEQVENPMIQQHTTTNIKCGNHYQFYLLIFQKNQACYFFTKTCLYNFGPLKPQFYIVKLGFTGVYIIFLICAKKHRYENIRVFYLKKFRFLRWNFLYLNWRVFVMSFKFFPLNRANIGISPCYRANVGIRLIFTHAFWNIK